MENYETLTEALTALRSQGYTEDFNLKQEGIEYGHTKSKLKSDEFHVDKFFRFEDNTDPDDQAIIYAISSEKYHVKGVLVNAYGIYSETLTNDMIEKLKAH